MGEDTYDVGMEVRRQVLGDEHVDRAMAGATELTAPQGPRPPTPLFAVAQRELDR